MSPNYRLDYIERKRDYDAVLYDYNTHLKKYGVASLNPEHHLVLDLAAVERMMLVAARDWANDMLS